jgi:hypothetical protein
MNPAQHSVALPSNRKFGGLFTAIFAIAAAYFYFFAASGRVALVLAALAALFAVATIAAPSLLAPLNRLWFQLGLLLGKIVSPLVLGSIFFLLITPVSLISRLFGRDELKMKKRTVSSYWVEREPPGPAPESFRNQF